MNIGQGSSANLEWLYEIRNGRAFGGGSSTGVVVAEIGHIQLLNPVGSTKTAEVFVAWGRPGALATMQLNFYDTALTTDVGTGTNLKSGGAASSAHIRKQTNPTALGTLLDRRNVPANTDNQLGPTWCASLAAGQGLVVIDTNTGEGAAGYFYWVEH